MGKTSKTMDDAAKKSLVVAQDMKLVKALAGNDKRLRDRAIKNLKKWFEHRNTRMPFTDEDFMRIWKGLFYAMWMSDKPLIQEECAENISKLIHFSTPESSLQFFKCGLALLTTEWFGIDQWRMNKFLMLVRRILRQGLEVLEKSRWKLNLIAEFGNILLETILKDDNSTHLGLTMHFSEIYLEELAKVSKGKLAKNLMTEFLKPFIMHLSMLNDDRQINHVQKFTFHHLMQQSDEGIEYENKFEAWKGRGFPEGDIESMQKVEVDDEEAEESDSEDKPLDPRAGQVDVILPQLKFDALEVATLMHECKFAKGSTIKGRKAITRLENQLKKLSEGIYPFGFKKIRLPEYDGHSTRLRKSVNRFVKFEKKLLKDSNKSRKRKNGSIVSSNAKVPKLDTVDFFQDKLQKFIDKSEGHVKNGPVIAKKHSLKKAKTSKPKLRKRSKLQSDWEFEDYFRRNSGTWFVHRMDSPEGEEEIKQSEMPDANAEAVNDKVAVVTQKRASSSPKKESPNNHKTSGNDMPKLSPKVRRKSLQLFSQKEWDVPPKEGEVEIFVPSNKFKRKMEMQASKEGKDLSEVLNNSLNKLLKTRYSLDSNLVRNPFAKNDTTPRSEKKVKIDLKLNKSQDIYEHQALLLSSPAIPYDANKKPAKPLLKPNMVKSPINPFYNRKLKL